MERRRLQLTTLAGTLAMPLAAKARQAGNVRRTVQTGLGAALLPVVLLSLILPLFGCTKAFLGNMLFGGYPTTMRSTLPLKPQTPNLKTPVPGGNERQVIVSTPFSDARQIKNRCGVQKDWNGIPAADAVGVGDPAQWIADFLTRELQASGFTVFQAERDARDNALKIEGILAMIFVEDVVGPWAATVETDLAVTLVVTSKTGLGAERKFFVKSGRIRTPLSFKLLVESFNDSLDRATRELLGQMVNAILDLMRRYPELGSQRQRFFNGPMSRPEQT